MKKTVLVFAIFIACVFMTFAQAWEKTVAEDEWGDKNFYQYSQHTVDRDSKYTYTCVFIIAVDDSDKELSILFASFRNDTIVAHPVRNSGQATLKIRKGKGHEIKTLHGERQYGINAPMVDMIAPQFTFSSKEILGIADLLTQNESLDVVFETDNWSLRTRIVGNLPIHDK